MSRVIRIAAAQMGGTQKADPRERTLRRILDLLEGAAAQGAKLVVFPELAFTTFFPRWLIDGEALDAYFERSMPNPTVQPLFDRRAPARRRLLCRAMHRNRARTCGRRFNSSILVEPDGSSVLGRYRKIHLPGTQEPRENEKFQQLEKRYFRYGDLRVSPLCAPAEDWRRAYVGRMNCNDRRWPEAVARSRTPGGRNLVCLGYNSAAYDPNGGASEDPGLRTFHSKLVTQANAYMTRNLVAVAAAKAGKEEDGSRG